MDTMRRSVAKSSAREVHHKAVVLGDDNLSPPGFTACVLIDESHVTAHCYSERGLLAIDIFTCGGKPDMPMDMNDYCSLTSCYDRDRYYLPLTFKDNVAIQTIAENG